MTSDLMASFSLSAITFPSKRDLTGIVRKSFPLFLKGIFQGFTWFQDDADEFGAKATGHTVFSKSLVLHGGGQKGLKTLQDLVKLPRKKYVAEHERLVKRLRNPTPAALEAEAKEQAKDLKEAKRK